MPPSSFELRPWCHLRTPSICRVAPIQNVHVGLACRTFPPSRHKKVRPAPQAQARNDKAHPSERPAPPEALSHRGLSRGTRTRGSHQRAGIPHLSVKLHFLRKSRMSAMSTTQNHGFASQTKRSTTTICLHTNTTPKALARDSFHHLTRPSVEMGLDPKLNAPNPPTPTPELDKEIARQAQETNTNAYLCERPAPPAAL